MNVTHAGGTEAEREARLPMRDWILLPAVGLLTIIFLAVSTELTARKLLPVSQTDFENCFVTGDPSGAAHTKPNGQCSERMGESKFLVRYKFNSRGDREDGELGPKRPGTLRIVMLGSSMAFGLFVPQEMTFASLLPDDLSRRTGRGVELYNESTGGKFRGGPFPIRDSVLRFHGVLSANPDLILWIITPMDIENSELEPPALKMQVSDAEGVGQKEISGGTRGIWTRLEGAIVKGTLWSRLRYQWEQSRSSIVLEHYLIASEGPNQYVESYLQNGSDADFLKTQPSAHWQARLKNLEGQAEGFEKQANDAGIPFVAVLLPNRAQAAMISTNSWRPGYDPYKLDDELRAVIGRHGGTFIDVLPDFRSEPDPWKEYFPVDGHLDAKGHAMVSRMLAKELTAGAVPSLTMAAHPQPILAQGK